MKIRDGYLLRTVAGKNIVVSVGSEVDFNGMLTLNDTGVFLWKLLQEDISKEQILTALLKEYDVSESEAKKDIGEFLSRLREAKLLED